jgi:hypothetical protein
MMVLHPLSRCAARMMIPCALSCASTARSNGSRRILSEKNESPCMASFMRGVVVGACPPPGSVDGRKASIATAPFSTVPRMRVLRFQAPNRRAGAILPRSRHRPRASTEGSSIRKVNKTGVRFWTDSPPPESAPFL